ncbi:unnamed protein product [Ectocarpus fasciculatus]
MNNKPEHVYYDVQINNFESTGTESQPLRFQENRSSALVGKASDYEMSIVRFELDTYSLPSWIASIEPEQSDANKMIESVTLEYDGTVVQKYLTFIPTNKHLAVPNGPAPLQDTNTEYYYCNSFRHYCDLVNNAFAECIVDLKVAHAVALADVLAPKLIWNSDSDTASLLVQNLFYNVSLAKPVSVYFNRALYGKFTSFPADKNYGASNGKIYKLNLDDDYGTKNITLDISGGMIFNKIDQEYSTIANWSAVSSIVFTTNSIPIVASQQSEPRVYSSGSVISSGSAQQYLLVISDMATNDMVYKPNLLYVPSGEYRLISLNGSSPINDIDVNVYWKDKKGNLNPFYLQSGASASIKFYFRLKK